jgi:hypothetical protein
VSQLGLGDRASLGLSKRTRLIAANFGTAEPHALVALADLILENPSAFAVPDSQSKAVQFVVPRDPFRFGLTLVSRLSDCFRNVTLSQFH